MLRTKGEGKQNAKAERRNNFPFVICHFSFVILKVDIVRAVLN